MTPINDKRNAYWFQVGPRGSIGDAIVSENGAEFNKAWDGLWTGKASIHELGWDVEMAIPFKTLGFKKGNSTWGLKLIRYYMRNEETGYWPVANLNAHRFQVSDAGTVDGLEGITQGVGLDLVPYALAGADYESESPKTDPVLNAGLEAYYNITSNLKAAITLNTDFAQTEVDEQQINLTRFNLFYPEKRDFFLDGANYFNFGINDKRSDPLLFKAHRPGLNGQSHPGSVRKQNYRADRKMEHRGHVHEGQEGGVGSLTFCGFQDFQKFWRAVPGRPDHLPMEMPWRMYKTTCLAWM